jgi:DegV family protein with EDD domain
MTVRTLSDTAIVYDSTADLPAGPGAGRSAMVPLRVMFGTETRLDHVDLDPPTFYRRLQSSPEPPTTSQPPPAAFAEAYEELLAERGHVLSLHVSGKLSGTIESARLAAAEFDGRVTVIDTESVSASLASAVLGVHALLEQGTDDAAIAAFIEQHRLQARCFVALDTLTYLQRGGRIGRAQALAGQLLSVHPILEVTGGEVLPHTRVRGAGRVPGELVRCVSEVVGDRRDLRLIVVHADAPQRAEALAALVAEALPGRMVDRILPLGPAVGTHAGPGALGVGSAPFPAISGETRQDS